MNIKELQQLEIGVLLAILLNHLIFELPVITTIFILMAIGMMYYRVFVYNNLPQNQTLENQFKSNKVNETNQQITPQTSAAQLTETLNHEATVMIQELNQTNTIIKSAAVSISNSFSNLNTIVNEKEELKHLEPLSQISGDVIKALQFEDLTAQIIHSLQVRAQTLMELSNDIPHFTNMLNEQKHDQLVLLHQKWLGTLKQSKQKTAAKTVTQESVEEGDIDLF